MTFRQYISEGAFRPSETPDRKVLYKMVVDGQEIAVRELTATDASKYNDVLMNLGKKGRWIAFHQDGRR